jgi:hypothetical protein
MKYLNVQEVNPSLAAIVNEVSVTQSEIVITWMDLGNRTDKPQ